MQLRVFTRESTERLEEDGAGDLFYFLFFVQLGDVVVFTRGPTERLQVCVCVCVCVCERERERESRKMTILKSSVVT